MGSIGMNCGGNIGMGHSFGGAPHFPGQRFVRAGSTQRRRCGRTDAPTDMVGRITTMVYPAVAEHFSQEQ
jgi:hypothetical protein